jgi:hypothetical protein
MNEPGPWLPDDCSGTTSVPTTSDAAFAIVLLLAIVLFLMPEQQEDDDDGDGHPKKPKQDSATHGTLLQPPFLDVHR